MALEYKVEFDFFRSIAFTFATHYASDVVADGKLSPTGLVWRTGMSQPRQLVASPGKMTIPVLNVNNEFLLPDDNLTSNEVFNDWTADNPDSWTLVGTEDANNYVTEVSDFPNPNCGFISNGSGPVGISQTVFTPGRTYRVSVWVGNYTSGTLNIGDENDATGAGTITSAGQYNFDFTPTGTDLQIVPAGACNLDLDAVYVYYRYPYGSITKNMRVRVKMRASSGHSWVQMWEGKVEDIDYDWSVYNAQPIATVRAEDPKAFIDPQSGYVKVLQDVRSDEAITELLSSLTIPWSYKYRYASFDGYTNFSSSRYFYGVDDFIDFETGKATFAFVGDTMDDGNGVSPNAFLNQVVAAEMGRFFWDGKSSKFKMHNRHHDILAASVLTLDENDLPAEPQRETAASIANQIEVQYYPREVGDPFEEVYRNDNVPFRVPPEETKRIVATFRDADSPEARVAVPDRIYLRYTAYNVEDLNDIPDDTTLMVMTSAVEVSYDKTARKAEVQFSNPVADSDIYIHEFYIEGEPLKTYDAKRVTAYNEDSGYLYDLIPHEQSPVTLHLIDNEAQAQNYAETMVTRYGTPQQRIELLQLYLTDDDASFADSIINLDIGDAITVTNTVIGHDEDYIVIGMEFVPQPDRCRVRLVVDAKDRVNYLQFDVSKFDGTSYYAP